MKLWITIPWTLISLAGAYWLIEAALKGPEKHSLGYLAGGVFLVLYCLINIYLIINHINHKLKQTKTHGKTTQRNP